MNVPRYTQTPGGLRVYRQPTSVIIEEKGVLMQRWDAWTTRPNGDNSFENEYHVVGRVQPDPPSSFGCGIIWGIILSGLFALLVAYLAQKG